MATTHPTSAAPEPVTADPPAALPPGVLIGVTAAPGASLLAVHVAPLVAAALALDHDVVLADLTRTGRLGRPGDDALARPSLRDLVDAHRWIAHPGAAVREQVPRPHDRPYAVLPGLDDPLDWTTLGARSIAATLATLRGGEHEALVALVDPDLEGEAETGSSGIEARHQLARTTVAHADLLVVATSRPPSPFGEVPDDALLRSRLEAHRRPLTALLLLEAPGSGAAGDVEELASRLRQALPPRHQRSPIPVAPLPRRIQPGELATREGTSAVQQPTSVPALRIRPAG